jgi:hypothetical protein
MSSIYKKRIESEQEEQLEEESESEEEQEEEQEEQMEEEIKSKDFGEEKEGNLFEEQEVSLEDLELRTPKKRNISKKTNEEKTVKNFLKTRNPNTGRFE